MIAPVDHHAAFTGDAAPRVDAVRPAGIRPFAGIAANDDAVTAGDDTNVSATDEAGLAANPDRCAAEIATRNDGMHPGDGWPHD
jgi:hypothetical protein